MSHLTRDEMSLSCGCVGRCTILRVERFTVDDERTDWFFEFYTRVNRKASRWWRFKTALKIMLGRDHYCDALIWDDEEIQGLRDFLTPHLPREGTTANANVQFTSNVTGLPAA